MMQRFVLLVRRLGREHQDTERLREHLYIWRFRFATSDGTLNWTVPTTRGGVTASTEVIAAKRHTGAHASAIACKNRIANQQLAYAA
jgi:hypothetical protein